MKLSDVLKDLRKVIDKAKEFGNEEFIDVIYHNDREAYKEVLLEQIEDFKQSAIFDVLYETFKPKIERENSIERLQQLAYQIGKIKMITDNDMQEQEQESDVSDVICQ